MERCLARGFGVRCETPLWFAKEPPERLPLRASRLLVRVPTKARTPASLHPAREFVCEQRHQRPPLLHSARCFIREPKRRWRAALQKLRGESDGAVLGSRFWSAVRSTALVRQRTTGTPSPSSIPSASSCANQGTNACLSASRPLLHSRTKAALARRTPKTARRMHWAGARLVARRTPKTALDEPARPSQPCDQRSLD